MISAGILIVDRDAAVRENIGKLLRDQGFSVVGQVGGSREAVSATIRLRPGIVILDAFMPAADGLRAVALIRMHCPRTRTIAMTMHTETPYVMAALRADMSGYVVKTRLATCLGPAIRAVAQGGIYLCPAVAKSTCRARLSSSDASRWVLSSTERHAIEVMAKSQKRK